MASRKSTNRAALLVPKMLWNPFVAAWYKGGKSDPALALLRFDPQQAQIWLNENSLFTGVNGAEYPKSETTAA